jgi:hypothetical protein
MSSINNVSIFIVHYTKLIDRKAFLDKVIIKNNILVEWITEKNYYSFKNSPITEKDIMGISPKKLGMDLGINSRSLVFSRRKARFQGYILFLRSFISHKNNLLTTGSLPIKKSLPEPQLEVQRMHMTALKRGIETNSKWILILEDDAIPAEGAFDLVYKITKNIKPTNIWVNLNSGAGLKRTKSDPIPDTFGLFQVSPAATRCVTACLISRDLAIRILELVDQNGLPEWLPIDFILLAALRKTKARAFWQEPVSFLQGSEEGHYKSSLEGKRG